jgi:hypothetical protein
MANRYSYSVFFPNLKKLEKVRKKVRNYFKSYLLASYRLLDFK